MKHKVCIGLLLVLTLAACAGQAPREAALLPLQDLPAGLEGPSVSDNTGTSAVIQFTSGVPTVCNVAYGTDATYRSLATMPMMGGAVREHAVTLTGLVPGTTYHYRITLTDEQARVYQSEDLVFTSTAVSGAGAPGQEEENLASLASGARVTGVSSNWSGGDNDSTWGANNALDGQPGTEWSSDGDGDDAWIEIELARTADVHAIGFHSRRMLDGTAQTLRFTVTTDEGQTLGPFDLPDAGRLYTFPVEITARTLRFDAVETSGGNTGAVEIAVYGTPHE